LNFTYTNTDGSNEYDGRYTFPINPYNGTLGFHFRIVDNRVIEPPFDELDIKSDTNYYDFIFRQPIVRTASSDFAQELALGLTFSLEENETSLRINSEREPFPLSRGANNEGKTRASVLRFFQEWTRRSRRDVVLARSLHLSLAYLWLMARLDEEQQLQAEGFSYNSFKVILDNE
jgi:hemolysin activation/secretion protein